MKHASFLGSSKLALLALFVLPFFNQVVLAESFFVSSLFSVISPAESSSKLEKVTDHDDQWWLPDYLKEASGIAVMEDQSILLHDDEFAVIYRVSLTDYSIEPFGWLGSPEFERDFEGIALDGETLYLMTSDGLIYYATVDLAGRSQTLDFSVFDTGLASICELEGLHFHSGKLLLPCKVAKQVFYRNKLVIFEFDVKSRTILEHLVLPKRKFGTVEGPHPSAIKVVGNDYYVVSTNYLLVINGETEAIRVFSLPKSRHFQPEGIGFLDDGSFVIVEDFRKGESRLTHYEGLGALKQLQ